MSLHTLKALAASPYPDPEHPLPTPIIVGGAVLMVATVVFCAFGHATGIGRTVEPAPVTVATRDLVFTENDDKTLTVRDADHGGQVVKDFDPEDAGFITALVRGMTRNRTRYGEPAVGAFRVSLSRDGGVWLQDLGTHQNVDLRAFGPTQVQAFAQFVRPEGVTR